MSHLRQCTSNQWLTSKSSKGKNGTIEMHIDSSRLSPIEFSAAFTENAFLAELRFLDEIETEFLDDL